MSLKDKKIRITVVGDGGIGKTSMLIAYKDKTFDDSQYIPTVFDVYSMTVPINQEDYTIILSDTAGQEEFDKLRKFAYKNVDVFILCYATNERNSFENVRTQWNPEIKHSCPHAKIVLAGTKADDVQNSQVLESEGKKLAKIIKADGFIQNSAKSRYNIDETFAKAISVALSPRNSINLDCCSLL
ncbi:ras-like GTP-binding protein RhoL [Harmonia axyridis]|uniref:ras-like GTP-binding protein RhoL n=1 Tax=Harmonia axyridis TaxID=115357 RepID=UPI001E279040|nr:ras-like GTP-binding protein RhoL [Harmonia axyridis]